MTRVILVGNRRTPLRVEGIPSPYCVHPCIHNADGELTRHHCRKQYFSPLILGLSHMRGYTLGFNHGCA